MEIEGTFKTSTPRAVKIAAKGKEVWLPLSQLGHASNQIILMAEPEDTITIDVPSRLAREKGLL